MNRKGSFEDLLFMIPIAFMVGIIVVIVYVLVSQVNTQFHANGQIAAEGKTIVSNAKTSYVGLFDGVFLVVIVSLLIFILILASQVSINPIFMPF